MTAAPTATDRGEASERARAARELAIRALEDVRQNKLHFATVHAEDGLRRIEAASVLFTSDLAALDNLIAAAAVIAEVSRAGRYAALAVDAAALLRRAVALRVRVTLAGK